MILEAESLALLEAALPTLAAGFSTLPPSPAEPQDRAALRVRMVVLRGQRVGLGNADLVPADLAAKDARV